MSNTNSTIWRKLAVYLSACGILLLSVGGVLLWGMDRGAMHMALNAWHTPCVDVLMRAYTFLAECPLYVVMALVALWRPSASMYFFTAELLSASLTQILKWTFRSPRPVTYFGADFPDALRVAGVHLREWNSFPSGHTATFFIFFTVGLILLLTWRAERGKQGWGIDILLSLCALILAMLGGYSRIYLSQHFLVDVWAGCLVGVVASLAIYPLFLHWDANSKLRRGWLSHS